jgi:hypothetical protein
MWEIRNGLDTGLLAGLSELRDYFSEVRMSGGTKLKSIKVTGVELKKAVWT